MAEREFYRYRLYESTKKEQKALKQTVLTTINRFKSINCQILALSFAQHRVKLICFMANEPFIGL